MTDTPAAPPAIAPWIARGAIDAELAALTWLLVEAGVPLLVAGTPGTGRARCGTRSPPSCRPNSTTTVLRGDDEDFDMAARGRRAGLAPRSAGEPAGPRSSSGLTVMVADLDDRPGGTWGERARIAIRALSLGYGMLATVRGDRLEDVFERLGGPPVEASEDELSRLGLVLVLGDDGGGSRRPTTSGRSPATSMATSSGSRRRSSRPGTRRSAGSSTSPGASATSSRIASG